MTDRTNISRETNTKFGAGASIGAMGFSASAAGTKDATAGENAYAFSGGFMGMDIFVAKRLFGCISDRFFGHFVPDCELPVVVLQLSYESGALERSSEHK